MANRRVSSGGFDLPLTASVAIGWFTPEGERAWVPGWNPVYPEGQPSELPGTVFTTSHGPAPTVWVIQGIDRAVGGSSYSRLTVGHHAGVVRVRCRDQVGGCRVTVEYDMTVLPGCDPSGLDAYDEPHFAAMMDDWAAKLLAAI